MNEWTRESTYVHFFIVSLLPRLAWLDLEQGAEMENDQDEEKTINAIQQNSSCYQYLIRLHLLHFESERSTLHALCADLFVFFRPRTDASFQDVNCPSLDESSRATRSPQTVLLINMSTALRIFRAAR